MSRRLILIVSALTLVAGSAFLYVNRKAPAVTAPLQPVVLENSNTVQPLPVNELPLESGRAALTMVFPARVTNYWVDPGDRTVYVAAQDGVVYSILPGSETPTDLFRIPTAAASTLSTVTGSGVSPAALIEYRTESGTTTFAVINPVLNKSLFLPAGTGAAAWSPNGQEVVYAQEKFGSPNGLFVLTIATNKSRRLTDLPIYNPTLSWITPDELAISTKSSDSVENASWRYSIKNKTLSRIGESEKGLVVRWSGDGSIGLRYTPTQPSSLVAIDRTGKKMTTWSVQTVPEKCFLDSALILCATPKGKTPLRLRDAYLQRALYTQDVITATPLLSGAPVVEKMTTLFPTNDSELIIDAEQLVRVGGTLYFVNRYDQRLYAVPLED